MKSYTCVTLRFADSLVTRRVIELRNDIKLLSDQIKSLLEVALAKPIPSRQQSVIHDETDPLPFAMCNGVAPGSPAAAAV